MGSLGTANVIRSNKNNVTANQVASRLIEVTKAPISKNSLKSMKKNVRKKINELPVNSDLSKPFNIIDLDIALNEMKI